MVDLEGQDHGPSSSSVGDNDDDFIVYSKEGNNARWFKKEGDEVSQDILCEVETVWPLSCDGMHEEVFLAKIIHGDGAKVIKVGEVPLSKIKGTGSDGTIVQADIEDYLDLVERASLRPPTSKPKDKATKQNKLYRPSDFTNKKSNCLFVIANLTSLKRRDKKGLSKIADEVKSFTRKAKENSLKPRRHFHRVKSGRNLWDQAISRHHHSPTTEYLPWDRVIKVIGEWRDGFLQGQAAAAAVEHKEGSHSPE
ncbi:hypothetical protein Sjap_017968 [Stephania japonica]|uniref:Uncharacterized protein n=1 Tax=Stephania japonica TaxID=461633 RepID=A0AAP0I7B2_9MAGN